MLGTVPSLIMAAGFAIAFVGAYQSIQLATGAGASADRSATVGASTVELVNAVQDAELSQRNFMLTGSQSSRAAFDAVSQRVDQMLISRAPLTADASPGLGADNGPQTLITQRLAHADE